MQGIQRILAVKNSILNYRTNGIAAYYSFYCQVVDEEQWHRLPIHSHSI